MVKSLLVQKKYFLLFLFIVSFVVRLLFFSAFLKNNSLQLAFDSGHYHAAALSLVEGKGFTNVDGSPHVYRLPGYPIFLAAGYALSNHNVTVTLLVQCLLASFIPLLVFGLAVVVFPTIPVVAYVSSFVTVMHVGFLTFAGMIMSETLFTFFFLMCLLFVCGVIRGWWRWWALVGSGLNLGIASLIRPSGPLLLMAAIILLLLCLRPYRYAIKAALIFCGSWLAVVGMWLARNFLLTGSLFLHTLSGPHLLNHGAARVVMMAHRCSYQEAQGIVTASLEQRIHEQTVHKQRPLYEWERCPITEKFALQTLLSYPWQTMHLCVNNVAKTLLSLYSSELLFIDSGGQLPAYTSQPDVSDMFMRFLCPRLHDIRIVWIIYFEIFMHLFILLGLFGFFVIMLRYHWIPDRIVLYLLMFACLFILPTCICGFARLRLPIEPIFIMLSVRFWLFILEREWYEKG